ncbi:vWA domain-containing protein [Martelella mediterranea]|uniref:Ca-activated chloride channel family protein n=1 Tax=Martelella mediterranea TaxID=293089 RepID=A0A4R3NVX8_9HYPH|nr:VWA domain-containing protein [Martelella mediterranea]TCT41848.1 Ca-activated chloride channel family protein [Martelella mediterranea]
MKLTAPRLALMAMAGTMASAAPVRAADDVVIVYDASGSMWGQIDGTSKIEIARDVLGDLVGKWDDGTNLGLVAYGHRRQGDCLDIETMIPPGPLDKTSFIKTVNSIKPVGKTPISASVQQAADLLSYRDNPATVVLISDGVETCNADPCALSAQLAKQGVKFTAHVVGFDLKKDENANLSCIAENTGGMFVSASNAAELNDALTQVTETIEEVPSTPPDPEPDLPEVTLTGPEQVTTGSVFDFSWSGSINGRDFITIVPAGADEGTANDYIRVKDASEGRLTAPGTPGLYELRYALEQGRRTLASVPVEVVEAEVTLTGPEQVTTGSVFDFSWSGSINGRDFITIVPASADEGTANDYIRVKDASEGRLTAPGTPGLYELRYALEQGRRTLASVPVEVVEAEVGIAGPGTVRAKSDVDVSWSGSINGRDFVTIVPMGADEGTANDYIRVKDASEGRLTAPDTPGLYELRYVLEQGRRTLASAPLEVVGAEAPLDDGAGLSVPKTAAPGATIKVTWAGESDSTDQRIALAHKDQPDFSWISVQKVGEQKSLDLKIPNEAGLYEVRFLDVSGREVLGRSVVKVK